MTTRLKSTTGIIISIMTIIGMIYVGLFTMVSAVDTRYVMAADFKVHASEDKEVFNQIQRLLNESRIDVMEERLDRMQKNGSSNREIRIIKRRIKKLEKFQVRLDGNT